MFRLPREIADATDPEEGARRLGEALELTGPAPRAALARALADPRYAAALFATRKLPAARDRLLAVAGEAASVPPGALKVAAKGAAALLKWGMAGFEHAKPWVIERRLAACRSCPFEADAPDTLIYRGATVAVGKDARICTACNCLTNTKAALATEHCPERDPADPALSRWGETWISPEEAPEGPW